MRRPILAASALVVIALTGRADTAEGPWIGRRAAEPYLAAIAAAAAETQLPPALLAELIGTESGFRNVKNAHSSASGLGQQINGNATMARYHLDKRIPAQSIRGAALQLRECLDRRGTLDGALRCYGTTAALTLARRRAIEAQFNAAALYVPPAPLAVAER